jgi:hypothetical protein
MGHVLGIGTLWDTFNLVNPTNCDALASSGSSFSASFTGSSASSALPLVRYSATSRAPVENTGGRGTACGHWKESTFGRELMTGYVSTRGNPLSYLTAYSLRDMGYSIDEGSGSINAYDSRFDANSAALVGEIPLGGCLDRWKGAMEIGKNRTRV